MQQQSVPATFWRGGTSRALLFRARDLASFTPDVRSQIILNAMGSPDPDGRQIDGIGGGISSLSKAAIISAPGEGLKGQKLNGKFPGVSWADDGSRDGEEWDVVYRFVQVGIKTTELEWGGVCGNIAAAVAQASIVYSIIPKARLSALVASELSSTASSNPPYVTVPIMTCVGFSGEILRALVKVCPRTLQLWVPGKGEGEQISGVPGEAAPILIEFPIPETEGAGAVTGKQVDMVKVGGKEVEVSIFSTGVVNIFVTATSLGLPPSIFTLSPPDLDADSSTMSLLEDVRNSITQLIPSLRVTSSTPKVVLLGPPTSYLTTSSVEIQLSKIDLVVRAVSGGTIHRTVMGTTLTALTVACATEGSLVHRLVGGKKVVAGEVTKLRVGHPAGTAEGEVRLGKGGEKSYVVMMRTAREIMRGEVLVPGEWERRDPEA